MVASLFGGGSAPRAPEPPPPPPSIADPDIERRRKEILAANQRARGRSSTIMTGGQGDLAQAPVGVKKLTGE